MSDIKTPSGQIPPSVPQTPAASDAAAAVARRVEIEKIPPQLENAVATVRVEAQVASRNLKTGEVHLETPQGNIVVKADPPLPPETKQVVIDIPPGNFPRSAIVYFARQRADLAVKDLPMSGVQPPPLQERILPPMGKGAVISVSEIRLPAGFMPLTGTPGVFDADAPFSLPDANMLEIIQAQFRAKTAYLDIKLGSGPLFAPSTVSHTAPAALPPLQVMEEGIPGMVVRDRVAAPYQEDLSFGMARRITVFEILPPNAKPEALAAVLEKLSGQDLQGQKIQKPSKASAQPLNPMVSIDPAKPTEAGKIVANSPEGLPVLSVREGFMILQTSSRLPIGSQIVYQTDAQPDSVTTLSVLPLKPFGAQDPGELDLSAARTWPALEEAMQALAATVPERAEAVKNTLPTASPRLVPTVLFFIAALRQGEIENWLGEKSISALRQGGRKDLADRLAGDFGRISAEAARPMTGEWRFIPVPFLYEDHISSLHFYVRSSTEDEGGSKKDGEKTKTTRFVLDLNLSNIGDMQLDGYLKKDRLDIILRTASRLPVDIRNEIMARFNLGLEHAHLTGTISFQAGRQNWITVTRPPEHGTKVIA